MRPEPSNTNVSPWLWESAVQEHEHYLKQYHLLRNMGLTDEQADRYLDLSAMAAAQLERISTADVDFPFSDHATAFDELAKNIAEMRALLGYKKAENVD